VVTSQVALRIALLGLRNDARANDVAQDQGQKKRKGAVDPFIKKLVFAHGNEIYDVKEKQ
jgi:hypothetical protein